MPKVEPKSNPNGTNKDPYEIKETTGAFDGINYYVFNIVSIGNDNIDLKKLCVKQVGSDTKIEYILGDEKVDKTKLIE